MKAFAARLIGLLVSAAPVAALAQVQAQAPVQVVVQGRTIGMSDIMSFVQGLYGKQGLLGPEGSIKIETVTKSPDAMPSDAPYVSYQGREPGPPPLEIIWISSAARPIHVDPSFEQIAQRVDQEYVAAAALAVMDAGKAGATLNAIYLSTPANLQARLALGKSFAQAFRSAGDQTAAFAAAQAKWISSNIVPGTPRSVAYEMLKAKGLTAYNYDFVKGKPVPPPPSQDPGHVIIGAGCDMSDNSSGAWPYQGESLPKQEGVCAEVAGRPKSIPNPNAEITLSGAFNLYCGWTTDVVITFTETDRVKAVSVADPRSVCM